MLKCSPISRSVGGKPRSTIDAEMNSRISRWRWVSCSAMAAFRSNSILNALTVLNVSSPCQFFLPVFRYDLGVHGLLLAAGIASMVAAFERGDLDEVARQGALAGPVVVERALAATDRTARLAAIVAARTVEDRAELLPALARIAGEPDRRIAIPAARAARAIARELAARDLPDDLAPADLAGWRAELVALAIARDRFVEVRVAAIEAAAALDPRTFELDALLLDDDPAVRVAAVGAVPQPVPAALVAPLANLVTRDADPRVALVAAQVLCGDLAGGDPAPVL